MSQKRNKDLIIIGIIWILASIFVLILLCPQIDKMIQAEAIITLVFVTIFYAIQTQKLVKQEKISLEEEKKKRTIDYWERRITQFYKPFIDKLDALKFTIHKQSTKGADLKEISEKIDDLRSYFLEKKYMISKKISQQIESLQDILWDALVGEEGISMEDFELRGDEIRKIIKKEWDDIENIIRKFYGY